MAEWPRGTVTFLFTDLEGSTKRWEQYPATMGSALARHDRLLREAISANGGVVFKTVGDAFCAAFASAPAAVAAALTGQRALHAEPWGSTPPLRARMALHTGQAEALEGDYLGGPLNRVSRLLSLGEGGQILLSGPTADLVHDYLPPGARLHDLGTHRLKDVERPENVFQLVVPDLPWEFGPLQITSQNLDTAASVPAIRKSLPVELGGRSRTSLIAAALLITLVAVIAVALATQFGSGNDGLDSERPAVANNPSDAASPAPSATEGEPAVATRSATFSQIAEPTPTATQVPDVAVVASPGQAASADGAVVYMVNTSQTGAGRMYRIAARAGAESEDLSASLDELSPGGREAWVAASPNGAWLIFGTERFDPECVAWPCLVVAPADLSSAEVVRTDGAIVHSEFGAIASAGDVVIVLSPNGPHSIDLWAITRNGSGWNSPALLTAGSPYDFHDAPAFSADGTRVAFECGNRPYGDIGTAICEVGSDGAGFRLLVDPADAPRGLPAAAAIRRPAYGPDGSIVFETTWNDRIWRLPPGGAAPEEVGPTFAGESGPCVLADGRVASLWTGRPDGEGMREIKVMMPNGDAHVMLVTGVDVSLLTCAG
jgi:class 3 adenylate cyclase